MTPDARRFPTQQNSVRPQFLHDLRSVQLVQYPPHRFVETLGVPCGLHVVEHRPRRSQFQHPPAFEPPRHALADGHRPWVVLCYREIRCAYHPCSPCALPRAPIPRKWFLARFWKARRAVPSPMFNCLATARHDAPLERSSSIAKTSTTTHGLPSVFPFARAFRKPARTRSAIRLRSNSATAPSTVKIMRPVGVLVSSASLRLTNPIPSALKVSSARSRCETDRAKRSNFQHATTSNLRR